MQDFLKKYGFTNIRKTIIYQFCKKFLSNKLNHNLSKKICNHLKIKSRNLLTNEAYDGILCVVNGHLYLLPRAKEEKSDEEDIRRCYFTNAIYEDGTELYVKLIYTTIVKPYFHERSFYEVIYYGGEYRNVRVGYFTAPMPLLEYGTLHVYPVYKKK